MKHKFVYEVAKYAHHITIKYEYSDVLSVWQSRGRKIYLWRGKNHADKLYYWYKRSSKNYRVLDGRISVCICTVCINVKKHANIKIIKIAQPPCDILWQMHNKNKNINSYIRHMNSQFFSFFLLSFHVKIQRCWGDRDKLQKFNNCCVWNGNVFQSQIFSILKPFHADLAYTKGYRWIIEKFIANNRIW